MHKSLYNLAARIHVAALDTVNRQGEPYRSRKTARIKAYLEMSKGGLKACKEMIENLFEEDGHGAIKPVDLNVFHFILEERGAHKIVRVETTLTLQELMEKLREIAKCIYPPTAFPLVSEVLRLPSLHRYAKVEFIRPTAVWQGE
jgi:hypothetical protein